MSVQAMAVEPTKQPYQPTVNHPRRIYPRTAIVDRNILLPSSGVSAPQRQPRAFWTAPTPTRVLDPANFSGIQVVFLRAMVLASAGGVHARPIKTQRGFTSQSRRSRSLLRESLANERRAGVGGPLASTITSHGPQDRHHDHTTTIPRPSRPPR